MIPYTLYLIDDEESIREGISMALQPAYLVKTFSSGESALEHIAKDMPDLVLLDIGLPGINGIEVLGKIKNLSKRHLVVDQRI
jgi:DNA-binding response OmpR family regulator